MSDDSIENVKFPLKTVIVIIGWVGSLMFVYFTMKSEVESARTFAIEALSKTKDLENKWNSSNIALLTFRVDELTESVKDLSKSTNEVKNILRNK